MTGDSHSKLSWTHAVITCFSKPTYQTTCKLICFQNKEKQTETLLKILRKEEEEKKKQKTGKGNYKTSNGEIRPAVPMSSNWSSQWKKQVNKSSAAQVAFLPGRGPFEIILQTEPTKGRNAPTVFSHSPQFLTPWAPAKTVLPKVKGSVRQGTNQWKPQQGEFVHRQTYFKWGKGTGVASAMTWAIHRKSTLIFSIRYFM